MTRDEEAFIEAIAAAPGNNLPRMVYADWLEEHGRGQTAKVIRSDYWRWGGGPRGYGYFAKAYPDLADRLAFLPGATVDVVRLIDRGVLFVMSWWSALARLAFQDIVTTLRESDTDGRLVIVVVDIDGLGEDFQHELLEPIRADMSGAGEALWVRDGRPLQATRYGATPDELQEALRLVLQDAEAK